MSLLWRDIVFRSSETPPNETSRQLKYKPAEAEAEAERRISISYSSFFVFLSEAQKKKVEIKHAPFSYSSDHDKRPKDE